jgi:hypothetical protein
LAVSIIHFPPQSQAITLLAMSKSNPRNPRSSVAGGIWSSF